MKNAVFTENMNTTRLYEMAQLPSHQIFRCICCGKQFIETLDTPLYRKHLSKKEVTGLFHFGNGEKVSRYEFALKIAEIFEMEGTLINPIKSSELGWIANRPKDTSLINKKSEKLIGIRLNTVDECLKEIKQGEKSCHLNL